MIADDTEWAISRNINGKMKDKKSNQKRKEGKINCK